MAENESNLKAIEEFIRTSQWEKKDREGGAICYWCETSWASGSKSHRSRCVWRLAQEALEQLKTGAK